MKFCTRQFYGLLKLNLKSDFWKSWKGHYSGGGGKSQRVFKYELLDIFQAWIHSMFLVLCKNSSLILEARFFFSNAISPLNLSSEAAQLDIAHATPELIQEQYATCAPERARTRHTPTRSSRESAQWLQQKKQQAKRKKWLIKQASFQKQNEPINNKNRTDPQGKQLDKTAIQKETEKGHSK